MAQPNFVSNGQIHVSAFVVIDATADNKVKEATGNNQFLVGISQEGSNLAPIPGASSLAATTGDQLLVYSEGDVCLLQCGSGGWTAGQLLTGTTNGAGVAASSGQYYGAVALSTLGAAAAVGRVQVVRGKLP